MQNLLNQFLLVEKNNFINHSRPLKDTQLSGRLLAAAKTTEIPHLSSILVKV